MVSIHRCTRSAQHDSRSPGHESGGTRHNDRDAGYELTPRIHICGLQFLDLDQRPNVRDIKVYNSDIRIANPDQISR